MSTGDTADPPPDGPDPDDEIIINVPPEHQAGVWANWAALSESDHEFTLDFVRLDHSIDPNIGVVVARIGMSPKLLRQLCDVLGATWEGYAARITEDVLPEPSDDEGAPDDG
jgi:hypothetical protein